MREKAICSWSGGKDCAAALHEIQKSGEYHTAALFSVVTKEYDRISMHGVRRVLLQKQALHIGLPLRQAFISKNGSNRDYDSKMRKEMLKFKKDGVSCVVFGDVFLEDVRKYRENNLSEVGMEGIFPLWNKNTAELACDFIASGFKAIVTCVDSNVLDKKFIGKEFDESFLSDLPSDVDPCGENGEFHSFVFDGPVFRQAVRFKKGEILLRDNRFYYCDLIPEE